MDRVFERWKSWVVGSPFAGPASMALGSAVPFRRWFRSREPGRSAARAANTRTWPDAPAGGRILVVDGNVDSAESMATLLQMLGYDARTAYDGHQAVACARALRPDLVLMDVDMPDPDGLAAARELRRLLGSALIMIAVTERSTESDRSRARDAGFTMQKVKPLDWLARSQLIRDLLH
jgi:CheY-like chemotaxis protein